MRYVRHCDSPLGGLLLASDGAALTGLWLDGAKYYAAGLDQAAVERETPALTAALRWLDVYFSGRSPGFTPPLRPAGTPFQQAVWALLLEIPYGQTATYGEIAGRLARQSGRRASARAVGGAVGRNPISLVIPCHRVVGAGGSLTGYAGGVEKKLRLLALEGADAGRLRAPQKGSAL